ncbi:rhodanese-related sulfurtransferase [Palleronia sp. KMU-117]|uniref:oxygen-dependent tRNA uridine(34) hydroxylase TrhO n=1 Tax=Palleronia sp. KMU-117 TaxID=3434108 RepID=UPI003D75C0EC
MVTVAAFYRFAPLPDPAAHRGPLAQLACGAGVRGSILLAPEGVNGTIAGTDEGVGRVLGALRAIPGFEDLEWKESRADTMPFDRLKVRLKREIVTMGRPEADPARGVGTYVPPAEWNALISASDVAVIDTRNDYEVAIGTFRGAIDPGTASFGDFPAWWEANRARFEGKRIAMFCTGGIRCEKATAWLVAQGVQGVHHLEGGILKYLEDVPEADSLWDGDCYVFDRRVSVGHGLREGPHVMCFACGRPVAPEETSHPAYEAGVSCARCIGEFEDADRDRFRDRQRQRA